MEGDKMAQCTHSHFIYNKPNLQFVCRCGATCSKLDMMERQQILEDFRWHHWRRHTEKLPDWFAMWTDG